MADNLTLYGVPVKIGQLENQKWEAKVGTTTTTSASFDSKPGIDEIKKLVERYRVSRAVFAPGK